jgi:hypothetical protein
MRPETEPGMDLAVLVFQDEIFCFHDAGSDYGRVDVICRLAAIRISDALDNARTMLVSFQRRDWVSNLSRRAERACRSGFVDGMSYLL